MNKTLTLPDEKHEDARRARAGQLSECPWARLGAANCPNALRQRRQKWKCNQAIATDATAAAADSGAGDGAGEPPPCTLPLAVAVTSTCTCLKYFSKSGAEHAAQFTMSPTALAAAIE